MVKEKQRQVNKKILEAGKNVVGSSKREIRELVQDGQPTADTAFFKKVEELKTAFGVMSGGRGEVSDDPARIPPLHQLQKPISSFLGPVNQIGLSKRASKWLEEGELDDDVSRMNLAGIISDHQDVLMAVMYLYDSPEGSCDWYDRRRSMNKDVRAMHILGDLVEFALTIPEEENNRSYSYIKNRLDGVDTGFIEPLLLDLENPSQSISKKEIGGIRDLQENIPASVLESLRTGEKLESIEKHMKGDTGFLDLIEKRLKTKEGINPEITQSLNIIGVARALIERETPGQ